MIKLSDEDQAACAWAVAHLVDKHGFSSIVSRDGGRVELEPLLAKLTCEHKNTHMNGFTQVCDNCGLGREV